MAVLKKMMEESMKRKMWYDDDDDDNTTTDNNFFKKDEQLDEIYEAYSLLETYLYWLFMNTNDITILIEIDMLEKQYRINTA
jgi:hypothetical protein